MVCEESYGLLHHARHKEQHQSGSTSVKLLKIYHFTITLILLLFTLYRLLGLGSLSRWKLPFLPLIMLWLQWLAADKCICRWNPPDGDVLYQDDCSDILHAEISQAVWWDEKNNQTSANEKMCTCVHWGSIMRFIFLMSQVTQRVTCGPVTLPDFHSFQGFTCINHWTRCMNYTESWSKKSKSTADTNCSQLNSPDFSESSTCDS